MKTYITTFGTSDYSESHALLASIAVKYADHYIPYDEKDIDKEFIEKNKRIFKYKKGFGYFVWKPYFILKTLEKMNDGDVCLYMDVCAYPISDLAPIFNLCVQNGGIYLFDNRNVNPEKKPWDNSAWVKGDCFSMMDCDTPEYHHGLHVDAAFQVYQKGPRAIEFLKEYLKYCENENIITDLPSIVGKDRPNFYENRYDQAVLSLLSIKHKITLGREPSQWGTHGIDSDSLYPTLFNHHRSRR